MNYAGTVKINPEIPENINRIKELAYNVWWSWKPSALRLYQFIDEYLWENVNHNPIKFLLYVTQEKLEKSSKSRAYLDTYNKVMEEFDTYMAAENTWFHEEHQANKEDLIAYFSAEYGIHESLPIYSGGLGILAGDHVKSASDIGLPFVGIGLLYKQGYFTQRISNEGWQEAVYYNLDFSQIPLNMTLDQNGSQLTVDVDLPGRKIYANLWYIQAGRARIYLLDTNIDKNKAEDRWFTSQLYGGDQEMRISQEIILGIGGVKAMRALDLKPTVWHMNEGHSVFLGLERIRELVSEGLSFAEALELVRANTIFTTHTPVPAGNDIFPFQLISKYFRYFFEKIKISESSFLDLGKEIEPGGSQVFSLTVLALKIAGRANGVSELHGHVSRKLWEKNWEGVPFEENPIDHITNGVHTSTWMAEEISSLLGTHLGGEWINRLNDDKYWENIKNIPDRELWKVHQALKLKMIEYIRKKAVEEWKRYGVMISEISADADRLLDPDCLTIGFARRFATYKRAVLIFRDMERLKKILNNQDKPLQIIFSGKAHPKDRPGQEFIKKIFDIGRQEGFKGRIFFLEDYDMNVARYLIQGVDVWLNTPRRPYEASGTSGQKGPINGVINFSVLDGWWREAYKINMDSGWSIGIERDYPGTEIQDQEDALDIYSKLEKIIIPLYYDRDKDGVPVKWVKKMKQSMQTVIPHFSTDRMVKEYTEKIYLQAANLGRDFSKNGYEQAKSIAAFKNRVLSQWHQVRIERDSITRSGETGEALQGKGFGIGINIMLGQLKPQDVAVEIYYRKVDDMGNIIEDNLASGMTQSEDLGGGRFHFIGTLNPANGGNYEYTVRVFPFYKGASHKFEMGLIKWLD